jgi:hypothetical protein
MNLFPGSLLIGFFFGLFFGVGCALALIYAIYAGGYRRALEDSLREEKSAMYRRWLPHAERRLQKERAAKAVGPQVSSNKQHDTIGDGRKEVEAR